MVDRSLLVRIGGQSRQIPPGDAARLRGALNEAPIIQVNLQDDSNRLYPDRDPCNTLQIISVGYPLLAISGMPSGTTRRVIFSDMGITHSARLQLIGRANITARAGDVAEFLSTGFDVSGGFWVMTSYERADGTPLVAAGGPDVTALDLAGTRQMTGAMELANPVSVAVSSLRLDIGAANSNFIVATGSGNVNTLNGPLSAPGSWRLVRFDSAMTLNHSSSAILLPGGRSIAARVGDKALFRYLGPTTDAWECFGYLRGDGNASIGGPLNLEGALNFNTAAALTASGTVGAGAADTNVVTLTGSGSVSYLNGPVATPGAWRIVRFDSVVTLVNGQGLRLPGSANIATQIGDYAMFRYLGPAEDVWDCISYTRKDGTALVSSGGGTGDKSYTHTQTTAAAVWTVPHNLGKRPSVSVVDTLEEEVWPDVKYIDDNIVQITHGAAYAGKAYLN